MEGADSARGMLGQAAGKLAGALLTLVVAAGLVFFLLQILPGDPAAVMLGTEARPDTLGALRAELGLDRPLLERFLDWLLALFTLDLGQSHAFAVPVAELIGDRLVVSLPLALMALAFAIALGVPAGIHAALRQGRLADLCTMGAAQLGLAIPAFWIGILLVLVFAIRLRLLPAGGFAGFDAGILPALRSLLLPMVALGLPQAAVLARVTRAAIVELARADFVKTARSFGLTRDEALLRHALPNALGPILTVIGLQFSFLLAGTVIVENVFHLPGLGRLVVQAIGGRDLPTLAASVMLLVLFVVLVQLLVDVIQLLIAPHERRRG